jgi:plastocyanin
MRSKSLMGLVAAGAVGALAASAGIAGSAPAAKPSGGGGESASAAITLDQVAKKRKVKRTNLRIAAHPTDLSYNKKTLRAKPGIIRITMTNPSNSRHNIAVRFRNLREKKGKVVGNGGVSRVQVNLKRGRYRFFCSVGNHEAAGMKGTLIVR